MRFLHFLWIFFIPFLQILLGNEILLVSSQCLDDQKSLLLQLKGSFQYDSTLSNKLARWNHNTSECCNWNGVTCDLSGHVIALELDDEKISSGIENASALFSLQYLERLNLAYNKFNVGIPVGIGNLTNLTYLNLSNAGFVGQIPMMLSNLTRLVTLDLSTLFPDFAQPLKLENPNLSHFIENSTELRELYLDGVDLSAQRTEWCQSLSSYLPNLTVLSLRTCRISGPIDESLSKLHFLSFIRLDQNNLSTTVPEYFANFSNLTTLTLSSCNLQGTFPKRIFLSEEQVNLLEQSFGDEHKLESERKDKLAAELGLDPRQVAVWFQNRRARWKTKKLEEEYSKLKSEHDNNVVEKCRLENEVLKLKEQLNESEKEIQRLLLERCDGVSSNYTSPSASSFSMEAPF